MKTDLWYMNSFKLVILITADKEIIMRYFSRQLLNLNRSFQDKNILQGEILCSIRGRGTFLSQADRGGRRTGSSSASRTDSDGRQAKFLRKRTEANAGQSTSCGPCVPLYNIVNLFK